MPNRALVLMVVGLVNLVLFLAIAHKLNNIYYVLGLVVEFGWHGRKFSLFVDPRLILPTNNTQAVLKRTAIACRPDVRKHARFWRYAIPVRFKNASTLRVPVVLFAEACLALSTSFTRVYCRQAWHTTAIPKNNVVTIEWRLIPRSRKKQKFGGMQYQLCSQTSFDCEHLLESRGRGVH